LTSFPLQLERKALSISATMRMLVLKKLLATDVKRNCVCWKLLCGSCFAGKSEIS